MYDPASTILNTLTPAEGLGLPLINLPRDTGFMGSLMDAIVPTTHTEYLDKRKDGFNSFGARFRKKDYGRATLHAELGAILNVERSNTEGATIYVVRVNKKGEQRLSKPCHMCESAMRYCGIKRVIYSTNGGYEVMKL